MTIKSRIADRALAKVWQAFRRQMELAIEPGCGGVVFFGDSLTHLGKWDLLFPHIAARNLGLGGERSAHLLARVDGVVKIAPHKVFVLIGSNDLGVGFGIEEITKNVDTLFGHLREKLPQAELYLQGIMPRARKFATRIRAVNAQYRRIAARHGVTFIDLFPAFDDGSGKLRASLTSDGLHVNGEGYIVWRDILAPHVGGKTVA